MAIDPVTLAQLGLSAGTYLTGSKASKKARKSNRLMEALQIQAMQEQMRLAKKEEERSDLYRSLTDPRITGILKDPSLVSLDPSFAPQIGAFKEAQQSAEERLAETIPGGATGSFAKALTNLSAKGARGEADIFSNIFQRAEDFGKGVATGRPELGFAASGSQLTNALQQLLMGREDIAGAQSLIGSGGAGAGSALFKLLMGGGGSTSGGGSLPPSAGGATSPYTLEFNDPLKALGF